MYIAGPLNEIVRNIVKVHGLTGNHIPTKLVSASFVLQNCIQVLQTLSEKETKHEHEKGTMEYRTSVFASWVGGGVQGETII